MKGLPDADISDALHDLPENEYRQVLDDTIAQKERSLHDEDNYARRGKLMRFAASRGFTADEIMNALP
jgi:regulatory protein